MQTGESFGYSGISELEESSKYLVRYNRFVSELFSREFKRFSHHNNSNVCEFGAGTGTLSQLFKEQTGVTPCCIEVDTQLIELLRQNGFQTQKEISLIKGSLNFVFTSNVLEHIQYDLDALNEIYNKLEMEGLLLIYVPAFTVLFSGLDTRVGHYRRYSKKDLTKKLTQTGFVVEQIHYVDVLGFFAALVTKFIGYGGKLGLGAEKSLKFYDRYIFPISKVLDRIVMKHFLGKNLFCIARKTLES
jgi:hypothetical protein